MDENKGTYNDVGLVEEKAEPIYEPEKGKLYDRTSATLGLAKQLVEGAVNELGYESKVVVAGLGGDTASRELGSPWSRYSEGWIKGERLPHGQYHRVKTDSSDGEYAQKRIKEFKEFGRKIGEEIKSEEQKKKNLEHKVISVIAIAGLASSPILLSSNITGNAIAELSLGASNILGAVLFLLGVSASFLYFRRRRKV